MLTAVIVNYFIKLHVITPFYAMMSKKKSTDSPRARVFESRDHLDTQTILKRFYELLRKYKNDILHKKSLGGGGG
jgi:hypothetical protein